MLLHAYIVYYISSLCLVEVSVLAEEPAPEGVQRHLANMCLFRLLSCLVLYVCSVILLLVCVFPLKLIIVERHLANLRRDGCTILVYFCSFEAVVAPEPVGLAEYWLRL